MKIKLLFLLLFVSIGTAWAQTTAFNFQGRLNDGANPANGAYDLQFKLFDAITGGTQVGTTVDRPNLTLINGVFSTTLDFGAAAFTSGNRFLEISVRPFNSPNAYVVLGARQQILSVPLAVRATSAANADLATNATNAVTAENSVSLGGVAANNYARLNFPNTGNLQTSGNVGFGTVSPNTRLTLSGGAAWTSNGWTASMNMQNGSALGWEANATGQRFGIGQTNGGLRFFRTISGFGSNLTPAETDVTITDNGDIAQPLARNGLVKAMIVVDDSQLQGRIDRCYNGITNSSSGNCGFSVTKPLGNIGVYRINLGFDVTSRFVSVACEYDNGSFSPRFKNNGVNYRTFGTNSLDVFTFATDDPLDTFPIYGFTVIIF